jgi:hypothetical protein
MVVEMGSRNGVSHLFQCQKWGHRNGVSQKWRNGKWGQPPFSVSAEMGSATFFRPPYSSQHLFNTILLHHLRHPTFSSVRSAEMEMMEMGSATFFRPPYSSQHLFNTILLHHLRHPTFSSVRNTLVFRRNGVTQKWGQPPFFGVRNEKWSQPPFFAEMGSATFFRPPYSSQHLFNTILLHHLRHPTFSSVRNTLVFRTLQSFFFRNCQRPV